jgi:hypothetical protein
MAKGFGARMLVPQQKKEIKILERSVLKHFQCPKESRTGRRQDHNFIAIVTIGILAVLSGVDDLVAIEANSTSCTATNQGS